MVGKWPQHDAVKALGPRPLSTLASACGYLIVIVPASGARPPMLSRQLTRFESVVEVPDFTAADCRGPDRAKARMSGRFLGLFAFIDRLDLLRCVLTGIRSA